MEATGIYWKPVHWVLEDRIERVWVINARHMRNVPGRKTDVADAQWGAQLFEHGLVRPSFIPDRPTREQRDLTRYRTFGDRGTRSGDPAAAQGPRRRRDQAVVVHVVAC